MDGNFTGDAIATASNILSGKTAYIKVAELKVYVTGGVRAFLI
ncbi:hypothetical protein OW763_06280 [Clostridium aestuarii]|uniref:Uncharacterized protein n=1 Tax=Clostridium aestuarii TaxID=338193 RepID=A0ABT4D1A4_9CLOT|nr:hypothetical protein [Clostridium aestuarii]MCY6483955.1 hypothetical protein [Clostridium aestuarii]